MATLLEGVNEVLKQVREIAGDSGELSSLTDSARQVSVDLAISKWNEAIDEVFSLTGEPRPNELAENTITLATNDRDYALQADVNVLHFPFLDETNGRTIEEHPGGYLGLVNNQFQPSNYTGIPTLGAIRPTDGQLYLDRIPTSAENGLVYKYRYDKDLELTQAADTMPFNDVVFRSMVPVVSELWRRDMTKEFDPALFNISMGRAARYLRRLPRRTSYNPR